ncbi:hypothetical protein [Sandaracinus amylolyticus]|uniref:Alpha-mannosidase n=1 Tax=Sandaracinus amylolyticus TaxID=927083 RepID=A0A0F6W875_9BACT|nr:hypothetical protein [Sandaracinus amylolyticus]AKF09892.1 Alpha-mannosidase [Sandaracinus amylolyticus]
MSFPIRRPVARTLSVIALSFVLAACGARLVPLTPQRAVLFSSSFEQEAVRAAIIRALAASDYVAESEEPGRIVARYERRGVILRVEIHYDATRYEIVYLDSAGLSQQTRPDGQVMISANYQRRMQQLTSRIDDEVGRPEREAREAAERTEREAREAQQRQRDHELAVLEAQRQREQDARDAEARERDRTREAELERERLRTRRAEAEAEARRPVIVGESGGRSVARLRFSRESMVDPGYGTVRITGSLGHGGMAYDGVAGGDRSARQMRFPDYCRGFFADAPSHVLQVDATMGYLRVEAASAGDTTLALVSADGSVWCDDDGAGGLNPRIEGELPPGVYYVWVGSYRQSERAPYRLAVYDTGASAGAVVAVAPPRREAMSGARFRGLLDDFRAVPVYAQQPGVAAGYVRAGNTFTCAQIAEMVQATYVYALEVDVAAALWEGVVDPENAHLITAAFRIYANGPEFRARIGL